MSQTSVVRLPPGVEEPFEVYVNGVRQHEGVDYEARGRALHFPRRLARIRLDRHAGDPVEVYVNGVLQQAGTDYQLRAGALHFPRRLARDRVSGWRWLVGAFGIGTYRQDDSVDVRYERDGSSRVAQLAIEPGEE